MTGAPLFVDISAFQSLTIDWAAYKVWSASVDGISRVSMRSSYGTGFVDQHFQEYRAGALAAGIDILILYHYGYPSLNNPASEADWQHQVVGTIRPQDVLMLDFEEGVPQATAQWAYEWLARQEQNYGGKLPTIYASSNYVQNRLQDSRLAKYPLTLADWTYDPNARPACPPPWSQYTYLQYTDKATNIPGIPGSVDANIYLGGTPVMPLVLSPTGCVIDLVKSFQLDGGSQDKCGPWSVSELKYAGLPGYGPKGSANDVHNWASAEYTKYIGPDVVSNQNGSSIDNMHQFLKDAGLHWWDISAINPGSTQSSDLAHLHRALDAGYPVLVTVNELSVIRRDGSNPYPWQPRLGPVNHIFTIVGYTKDGYLLVDDELNQGDTWPDQYRESTIECHWASIVQLVGPNAAHPWLKPIPSDDPTAWPVGFNAQNFGGPLPPPIPPPPPVDHFAQETLDCWNSVYANLQNFAVALKLPMLNFSFAPPTGTGIYKAWVDAWLKGHHFGPPLTFEYDSATKDGVKIKAQEFAHARAEWVAGKTRWYTSAGEVLVP